MNSRAALLALAVGAFAIGTTEFAPMGLLPVIADGVGVGIPTAGMLITAYAVGVMLGAPVMTLLMGDGKVLPKFIPSFTWYLEGAITSGFGYPKLLETAEMATARRNRSLTEADKALLDFVYQLTRPERDKAVKKDRKKLLRR